MNLICDSGFEIARHRFPSDLELTRGWERLPFIYYWMWSYVRPRFRTNETPEFRSRGLVPMPVDTHNRRWYRWFAVFSLFVALFPFSRSPFPRSLLFFSESVASLNHRFGTSKIGNNCRSRNNCLPFFRLV